MFKEEYKTNKNCWKKSTFYEKVREFINLVFNLLVLGVRTYFYIFKSKIVNKNSKNCQLILKELLKKSKNPNFLFFIKFEGVEVFSIQKTEFSETI